MIADYVSCFFGMKQMSPYVNLIINTSNDDFLGSLIYSMALVW